MTLQENDIFRKGYWESVNHPKVILGPMVEQSERAFRETCSAAGLIDLSYTPMIHSEQYSKSERYRHLQEPLGNESKPVVAQICFNENTPEDDIHNTVVMLHSKGVAAVDINLGCPQINAKKHKYGGYLPTDVAVQKIKKLKSSLSNVHITAKIRIDNDLLITSQRIVELFKTGISALAIHSRERYQIQSKTGTADWSKLAEIIRKAREDGVPSWFPIISNGGIQHASHILKCLQCTGADAVMVAEGILWDPNLGYCSSQRIFSPICQSSHSTSTPHSECNCELDSCTLAVQKSLQNGRQYLSQSLKYLPTMYQLSTHMDKLLFRCRALWPVLSYQVRTSMPPVIDPLIRGAVPGSELQLGRMIEMWESLMKMYEICLSECGKNPDPRIELESFFSHKIISPDRYSVLLSCNFRDVREEDLVKAPLSVIPPSDSFVSIALLGKLVKLNSIDKLQAQSPQHGNPCDSRSYRSSVPEMCVEYAKSILRYLSCDTTEDECDDFVDLF